MTDNIIIQNARVSFPHLFTRPVINGEEGKYGARLMLDRDKNAAAIQALEEQIADLCKEKFKGRKLPSDKLRLRSGEDRGRPEYEGYQVLSAHCKERPYVYGANLQAIKKFKGRKLPSDKLCLRSGEDRGRPEYEGYQVLSAHCKERPYVYGANLQAIKTQDECPIHPGCTVNAKVRLWPQDNNFGKRINCELIALQFAGHGPRLDAAYVSPEEAAEGFKAVETPEEEDDAFFGDEAA